MSEAKRYAMTWATDEDEFVHVSPVESASGKWVNFEDYARLKAFSDEAQAHIAKEERKSRERLDMEQAENARLKAEVERLEAQRTQLIESAEKLFRFIGQELYGPIDHFEADWEAAKEGKPSV